MATLIATEEDLGTKEIQDYYVSAEKEHMIITEKENVRHFNIDPDTGEYYFTPSKTSNTVFSTKRDDSAYRCVKTADNTTKTKCFPDKFTFKPSEDFISPYTGSSDTEDFASALPDDEVEKKCPDDYTYLGYRTKSKIAPGSDPNNPTYYKWIEIACGR